MKKNVKNIFLALLRKKGYCKSGFVLFFAVAFLALIFSFPSDPKPLSDSAFAAQALNGALDDIQIVDVHEHIQSRKEVPKMIKAMDKAGIDKTVLLGSSWFTITLRPNVGFTRYDENNEELLKIVEEYPGRFEAWITIDPSDPGKLVKLKHYLQRGATGLKLYLGHGFVNPENGEYFFHTMAIDDPRMDPVYAFCEDNFVPVCIHVNPSPIAAPGFAEEFVSMLKAYPDLKVVCPHYMLSSIADSRLRVFLDTFPNLYSDISFGHDDFLIPGLKRISRDPEKFRDIFSRYPERFMFSCDLVVTNHPRKTTQWIEDRYMAYIKMLTQKKYKTPVIPGITLNGLALSRDLLEGLFYKNFEKFVSLQPCSTEVDADFDWERAGIDPLPREKGEVFPPSR